MEYVKPLTHKESSATYSINTTGKGIAKAQAFGDCAAQLRAEITSNDKYVIQINENFKENAAAFETGLVSVSLYVWTAEDYFYKYLGDKRLKSFKRGMLLGGVLGVGIILSLLFFIRS